MLNHRLRLLSSMLVAFLLVSLYGRLSTGPLISPIQADRIKNLLSNLKFNPNSLTRIFTINFNPNDNQSSANGAGGGAYVMPTVDQLAPQVVPTNRPNPISEPVPTDSTDLTNLTNPVNSPTNGLNPTNIPKPTKPPKPTPMPPITSDTRPGTSLMGIFQEVAKYECIPPALMMAFKLEETGDWNFIKDNPTTIKIYNTYGWWQTGAGDSCYGYAYDTMTGKVPADGSDAGRVCENPIPASYDQQIMGLMQISADEQSATRKYTSKVLPKSIDRRVLFDGALIFAVQLINRAGSLPMSCDSWPDSTIRDVAGKFHGSCQVTENSSGRNYCNDVINYYHQYSK